MPTSENLIPIRVDVEVEGKRFKDTFTWSPTVTVNRVFSYEGQDMNEKILPLKSLLGHFARNWTLQTLKLEKRKEWDLYEPIIDILSAEVEALNAKERYARLKKNDK